MFLNLFLFYQVVRPLGRKSVNKYLYLYLDHSRLARYYAPTTEGIGALRDAVIRPSVCLCHASRAHTVHSMHMITVEHPLGNPIPELEVEPTG